MKSIPTIFLRDKATRLVGDHKLRMVSWVFEGKGVATRKWDGVAIKVEGGKTYRRHEWVEGEAIPNGFIKVQDPDPKRPRMALPGWVPIPETFLTKPQGRDQKALKMAWEWLLEDLKKQAFNKKKVVKVVNMYAPAPKEAEVGIPDGTYELCGPDIYGNHDGFKQPVLLKHGADIVSKVPRTFEGLKKFLETFDGEGIVWHYNTEATTLMAKIKRRDFGYNVYVSPEDVAMAYRKESEVLEPYRSISSPLVHITPAETIFEKDNAETGDDISLTEVNPVLALL